MEPLKTHKKILVVIGSTSTGKSDLAVLLAQKFNGEVISSDSRQVYTGLDLGTGKVTEEEKGGIPHHLLDVADAKERFTTAQFKELAEKAMDDIWQRGKLPIVAGGNGFYVDALTGAISFPQVEPNNELREQLEKKTPEELFQQLQELDSRRAENIDKHNQPRLVRALEIVEALGSVPPQTQQTPDFDILKIGLTLPDDVLKDKIHTRLLRRKDDGMIDEVKKLHEEGLSWERMEELGLEYRYLSRHLTGTLTYEEMIEQLNTSIWHYAKRQKTYFRRDKTIKWFNPSEVEEIEKKVTEFLEK